MTSVFPDPVHHHPERRAAPRYPVRLPVELQLTDQPPRSGTVTQLGPGGARLAPADLPAELAAGDRLQLALHMPPAGPGGRFHIPVAVTGRTPVGVSVFFLDAPAAFTHALGRYLEGLASAGA
jgi:hypothetical protein